MIDRLRTAGPLGADGLLALALAAALLLHLVVADEPGVSAVGVIGGLGLTLPLAWRRRAPLAVALTFAGVAPLQAALGGELYAGEPPLPAAILAGALVFFSLAAHATERRAVRGALAGVAGLWTTVLLSDHRDLQSFILSAGLVVLSPWLAGRVSRARELRAAALERVAASEERQRIARELHDVVAHGVVLMVLQAQGARRILAHDPERARGALAAIEETGQTALDEIRRSLGLLRDEGAGPELRPQPTLEDLGELVGDMRQAGLMVELAVEGEARPLASGIDRSAYRIIQEALTNTIKHAGLVPTRVTVRYEEDDLRLEIADEGVAAAGDGDGGQGLPGMRERVRLHGGELHARRESGRGFVVRARIPLGT